MAYPIHECATITLSSRSSHTEIDFTCSLLHKVQLEARASLFELNMNKLLLAVVQKWRHCKAVSHVSFLKFMFFIAKAWYILAPQYPQKSTSNYDCSYHIIVAKGNQISLTLSSVDLYEPAGYNETISDSDECFTAIEVDLTFLSATLEYIWADNKKCITNNTKFHRFSMVSTTEPSDSNAYAHHKASSNRFRRLPTNWNSTIVSWDLKTAAHHGFLAHYKTS